MTKFKIEIEIEIAECWIEDGFNLQDKDVIEDIKFFLEYKMIGYSEPGEVIAKIHVKKKRNPKRSTILNP